MRPSDATYVGYNVKPPMMHLTSIYFKADGVGDESDPTEVLGTANLEIDDGEDEYDGDDEFDQFLKEQGVFTGDTDTTGEQELEKAGEEDHTIDDLPVAIYCDIVETLRDFCGQGGVMTLFNFNEDLIK